MAARLTAYIVVAIVTITLVAGLIVGAQRDDRTGPVDLIIVNGRVHQGGGATGVAEAVAIRGNQILDVGSNREIQRLRRKDTRVVDARGGSVLPGFNDAHAHFVSGGLALEQANLLDAATLAEIERAIVDFAAAHPESPWVLGRGWYYQPFPGGLPTRELLDRLVPDRPARMVAYDGHTDWVNSKALELAGITRTTPDPPNGEIVRNPRTGEPTGVLKEAARHLVRAVVPEVTVDDQRRALAAATAEAHAHGVTSVHNAHGRAGDLELLREARAMGELKVRVYHALSLDVPPGEEALIELELLRERFPDDPLLKAGVVKLMVDGVIESHTAAMLEPYADRPATAGEPMADADALDDLVARLDAAGWQVMIHAIGDRGVRMALDAFEHAAKVNPAPERGRRHRIEHIETIDPADVPRFAELGVIASMQPFHANPAPNQIDVWAAAIGPERAARGWAYRRIVEAGGTVVFGSDWPVVDIDPRLGLNMAVNRTTPQGKPEGGWHADERLPLASAVDAYTSAGAFASFDEHRKGRIEPGMLADIVVMSADIFGQPSARLLEAVVVFTIFDGKVVYERPAPAETN
ncbi:MAG: amidohydrolase [Acidobacteria bacterium]|nr:amidohydrolase [Acidobacteriota bacterium]